MGRIRRPDPTNLGMGYPRCLGPCSSCAHDHSIYLTNHRGASQSDLKWCVWCGAEKKKKKKSSRARARGMRSPLLGASGHRLVNCISSDLTQPT